MPARSRLDRAAQLALALALYPISRLARRKRRRWAFGHAGDLFAGNPKYLFLWLRLHRPEIDAVWITGSAATRALLATRGLPVALRWSVAGIRAALGARMFVFAHDPGDVNLPLSRGARHLNLWHGVGLKALHTGARPAGRLRAWLRSFVYVPYQIVVSTSDMMQAHFAAQFRLPPASCPQLGYPRLDWSADPALRALARATDADPHFRPDDGRFAETYLYMPTFRDTRGPFLAEALPDPAALDAALAARDAVLYVKLHPRTADPLPQGHDRIRPWPPGVDFQTHLADLTGLITDYSSVLYDWLAIRDDGAILYTFDLADYLARDRDLLYPFEENVAGVQAADFGALCSAIATGAALGPPAGDVAAIRQRFWGGSPRPASPAILDYAERSRIGA